MINSEKLFPTSPSGAAVGLGSASAECMKATGRYQVECYGADGKPKWSEDINNIVTTGGKNDCLDKYLAGSAYTAAFYVGLISATGYTSVPVIGDTMASHATWAEDQNYSQTARPTAAWSAAASGAKSLSSAAVFSITASTTIKGCFLATNSTKGGTTGVLYSAGLFTGGDKVVANGDTINVSYSASM